MKPIPVSRAMKLADVDPIRFNEAIGRGHYRCAPETKTGVGREFTYGQMVALYVFGRLIKLKFSAREAAAYACNSISLVENHRLDINTLYLECQANGSINQVFRDRRQGLYEPTCAVYICINFDVIKSQIEIEARNAAVASS